MTVNNITPRTVVEGDGSNDEFDFAWTVYSESTIVVVYTDEDGLETTLSPGEYTVDLNPIATNALWPVGGTITYPLSGDAIASGTTLTIYRDIPYSQAVQIANQGAFYPENVERMGDVAVMEIQQLNIADDTAAAAAAAAAASAATAALYSQQVVFTAEDGTDYTAGVSTSFVIPDVTFPSRQYLLILRNGVVPYAQADFTISNDGTDTTVTFVAAIAADVLTIECYYGIRASSPTEFGVTNISFGTTGLTPASMTDGDVTVAGTLSAANGGTGVANNAASTITISGSYAMTLTLTGVTGITLPTSGTLATLAGTEELDNKTLDSSVGKGTWTASGTWTLPAVTLGGAITYGGVTLSNAVTGTGKMVLDISPALVTPTLGVASATSINFGGTALANYVEGTFTVGLTFGGGSTGMTIATNVCSYTRIGNRVFFNIRLVLSAKGSSTGNVDITGLPLTSKNTSNLYYAMSVQVSSMAAGLTAPLMVAMINNATNLFLSQLTAGSSVLLTHAEFSDTSAIIISGCYEV